MRSGTGKIRAGARGAAEDLAGVPGAVGLRHGADAPLWADEGAPRECYDVLAGYGAAADEVL